jgi:hypothetical protein
MPDSFWDTPEWVPQEIIQKLFNDCQYYEKVLSGDLKTIVFGNENHLSRKQSKKANEPYCTRSQMVAYYDSKGNPVALVHQYRHEDGSLGGSGKPDPKRLFVEGKIIASRQSE